MRTGSLRFSGNLVEGSFATGILVASVHESRTSADWVQVRAGDR